MEQVEESDAALVAAKAALDAEVRLRPAVQRRATGRGGPDYRRDLNASHTGENREGRTERC